MEKGRITEDTKEWPRKIYANQLVTIDDLQQMKQQIVEEILSALRTQLQIPQKKWMKAHEVRRLLKISPGTLQTLKNRGIINYTKVGGVHFFNYEEIQRLLESGKHGTHNRCLLYTSPSPRDRQKSRMPSSA